jgi:hypothetical protein
MLASFCPVPSALSMFWICPFNSSEEGRSNVPLKYWYQPVSPRSIKIQKTNVGIFTAMKPSKPSFKVFWIFSHILLYDLHSYEGCAIAQAVSYWIFTAEAHVHTQGS